MIFRLWGFVTPLFINIYILCLTSPVQSYNLSYNYFIGFIRFGHRNIKEIEPWQSQNRRQKQALTHGHQAKI
jgi:hypothetical protein